MQKKTKIILIISIPIVAVIGLAGFLYSGVYNIGAVSPHYNIEVKMITLLKDLSVKARANYENIPPLDNAELIKKGFKLYNKNCVFCHGAPGVASSTAIRGLNPAPPPLVKVKDKWNLKQIDWIIKNGFKMTGMPGFKINLNQDQINALNAFVVRMNTLSPKTYELMAKSEKDLSDIQWTSPAQGWQRLKKSGDIERGKMMIQHYGCATCHTIAGISSIKGKVGPPLKDWKKQHYIAGKLVNNPINLVNWLRYPQKVESHTSMPALNINEKDAWDISAYLLLDSD